MNYQDAVLKEIEEVAEAAGLGTFTEYSYTNIGAIFIGSPSNIVASISFDFQGQGKNTLLINGAKHGPPGPDNYYFSATETGRYREFIDRVKELVKR